MLLFAVDNIFMNLLNQFTLSDTSYFVKKGNYFTLFVNKYDLSFVYKTTTSFLCISLIS